MIFDLYIIHSTKKEVRDMKKRNFYFQGNIEGNVVICNISEPCQFSRKPHILLIPAQFCNELIDDEIEISVRDYNRLERAHKLIFK